MSTTNGASHQNVDDILKSIRSASGDQNLGTRFIPAAGRGAPSQSAPNASSQSGSTAAGSGMMRRDQFVAESADFDLPAIFKPGHQAQAEKPNLFGRLSDAWKPSPQEPERPRTVIRFEPASAPRMLEPPRNPVPSAPPAVAPQPHPNPAPPTPVFQEHVKREMPTFFDTRLNRMGQTPQRTAPPGTAVSAERPLAAPSVPMPPALVDASRGSQQSLGQNPGPNPGMEDAAAQLLRPILQQWLSENMPKIVEKALRSESNTEAGDSGFAGSGPRKPPR